MSPMVGDSLSVVIQGENLQKILLMSNHRQRTSATYENQVLLVKLEGFMLSSCCHGNNDNAEI